MTTPNPSEVAPWYLRNINQALALDDTTGNVYVRTDIGSGGTINIGNVVVTDVTISELGNIDISGNTMPISGTIDIGTLPEVEIKNDIDNPIPISKDTNVNSITNPLYVSGVNNTSFFAPMQSDSFGRLRVSNPQTLFDTQARYYDHEQFASNTVGGGNVVYNANSSTFNLNVTNGSTDSVIRETYRVFPYQPGKSLLILTTFCMNESKTNLRQRVGYFGANNGIYFEDNGGTFYMVIRSSSSGVIVEDRIPQNQWNGDRLDGSDGPNNLSGIDLDPALVQIFWTDIEWLGVGSVRTGFVIDGNFYVCHTFNHANTPSTLTANNTTTYMTTATLPLRYEITNTAGTTGSSTLRQICSSVISEGGYQLSGSGNPKSASHLIGSPVVLPNDNSFKPVISIRLKSTNLDAVVIPINYSLVPVAGNIFQYRVYKKAITTGGSWVSSAADSSVEYNLSPTTLVSGDIAEQTFLNSTNQSAGAPVQQVFGFTYQLERDSFTGVAYEYVITMATTGQNQNVYASIEWQEIT
jgi:hypothetical protein